MIHPKLQEVVNEIRHLVSSQGRKFAMRVRNQCDVMVTCPMHWDIIPSLHITLTNDGAMLFYCFAGCNYHSIASQVHLNGTVKNGTYKKGVRKMKEITRYTYVDSNNEPIFQVVRQEPKAFYTCWASDEMKEKWSELRPFYCTPIILEASEEDIIVFCEGEKDVHTLMELGCIATCTPHGASLGLYRMDWNTIDTLKCKNFLIAWDYDVPGLCYSIRLLAWLCQIAKSIGLIPVNVAYGCDISDYVSKVGQEKTSALIQSCVDKMIEIPDGNTMQISDLYRNTVFISLVSMMLSHTIHVTKSHLVSRYATLVSQAMVKYTHDLRSRIVHNEKEFMALSRMVIGNGKGNTSNGE
jgi:hypothetical protein